MWCRMVDIGAHHVWLLLLQALFMIASVLIVTSTTAVRTITKGVFICDLATAGPPEPTARIFVGSK